MIQFTRQGCSPRSLFFPLLRSRSGATLSGPTTTSSRSCGLALLLAPSLSTSARKALRSSTSSCKSEAWVAKAARKELQGRSFSTWAPLAAGSLDLWGTQCVPGSSPAFVAWPYPEAPCDALEMQCACLEVRQLPTPEAPLAWPGTRRHRDFLWTLILLNIFSPCKYIKPHSHVSLSISPFLFYLSFVTIFTSALTNGWEPHSGRGQEISTSPHNLFIFSPQPEDLFPWLSTR